MFNKEQYLSSIQHELNIIKHLHSKCGKEQFDYKPQDNMRSMIELMQYIALCGVSPMKSIINENWEIHSGYASEVKKITPDNFVQHIDKQWKEIQETLADVSDDTFNREITYPWGGGEKLGAALINCSLKFLTAYRMQMFLYMKQSGVKDLNTFNCWAGCDGEMPA